jgi:CDP-diacylglycerol--inositol 3-phosphatidyltransferase
MSTRQAMPVALYIPNLMGYARILLAFFGLFISSTRPVAAIWVWLLSASLDLLDGIIARALNQTSSFGILLDISADNILRTCVWIAASRDNVKVVACFFISLEWVTMICTQLHSGDAHWKSERQQTDPWFIRTCFHNNFRNPLGMIVIYGLFSANMWTYGSQHAALYETIPGFELWRYLAYVGRTLGLCVEVWLCHSYLSCVIARDTEQREQTAVKEE